MDGVSRQTYFLSVPVPSGGPVHQTHYPPKAFHSFLRRKKRTFKEIA